MACNKEALRRARSILERFKESQREFAKEDFREAVRNECKDLSRKLYDDAIDGIVEAVDNEDRRQVREDQPTLPCFNLDGVYKTGEGTRIARKYAMRQHAEQALLLSDQNLMHVQTANMAQRDELIRLTPYWGPGVPKYKAVEAYEADNHGRDT
jgi:hypothetical protein